MNACQHGREPVSCITCRRIAAAEQAANAYYTAEMVEHLYQPFSERPKPALATIDPAFTATQVTIEDEDA